jgi:pyruvate/2-oxoacid:ferredoxin oxidoreductase beta subunit/Pyruvate/2-oxoacid:ferredoxin oxidoreductase gamma subunit/Pyruvate/2-oxoacid:ferredoxin oxidoreductase delta subunit
MRGHSIGGFGSVTTNKVIASVAAAVFGKHVQAFPKYGSEKKGLPTSYYLTVADEHVRLHGELSHVDLVALHDLTAFEQGHPLAGLAPGGTLFLNTGLQGDDLWKAIPPASRKKIRELRARILALDTTAIAKDLAPSPELVLRMQGIALLGVFLRATPFREEKGLPESGLFSAVEKALEKYFGKRGRAVIEANLKAVERGFRGVREVPLPLVDPSEEVTLAATSAPAACGSFGCVLAAYAAGTEETIEADVEMARSLIPPGSAARRDFVHLAAEIPELLPSACVGCMECVAACPDSAILAKVALPDVLDWELADDGNPALRTHLRAQFTVTQKFHALPEKNGEQGGLFGLAIDPTKCKGCGECVEVCGSHAALRMVAKTPEILVHAAATTSLVRDLPATPSRFLSEKALGDLMLSDAAWLYEGGAGSCMGCGEGTAIRMLLAATGFSHGRENVGLVAATGCNSVFGSTYPYNPFLVPWTNSLFENSATVAMGIRGRWDQLGWQKKRLWVIAGDGAMYDIGFQALSRLLVSGMDVKVLVLDTQAYSNTGGQASGSTFVGQEAKMAAFGAASQGKVERRKELGILCAMHPRVFVAQTTPAHVNHFYKAVTEANAFPGPAVVIAYAPCMPEHGIADDMASHQSKLAVESRAFPLFVHDPRKGEKLSERLDLRGNPAVKQDWYSNPKSGEPVDFIAFAKTEGRFRRHFGADGELSEALLAGQADRLANWRLLQELAGVR